MIKKFCTPYPGCYTGEMLFANASKFITNWFLRLQLDIFKVICNLSRNVQERAWHICLCTNLCTYLFMYLCQRKKNFIKVPALILNLKLQTSVFCRFCILKWRILGWWVWNLVSFWHKLWDYSICEWPLTQLTNIGKAEIFYVQKPEY